MPITDADELAGIIAIYGVNKMMTRPDTIEKLDNLMDGSISEFNRIREKIEIQYSDIAKSRKHNINNEGNLYDDGKSEQEE
jgi:hypothetical protein